MWNKLCLSRTHLSFIIWETPVEILTINFCLENPLIVVLATVFAYSQHQQLYNYRRRYLDLTWRSVRKDNEPKYCFRSSKGKEDKVFRKIMS